MRKNRQLSACSSNVFQSLSSAHLDVACPTIALQQWCPKITDQPQTWKPWDSAHHQDIGLVTNVAFPQSVSEPFASFTRFTSKCSVSKEPSMKSTNRLLLSSELSEHCSGESVQGQEPSQPMDARSHEQHVCHQQLSVASAIVPS